MRFAVISDIHSNLAALQSVFKDIDARGVDHVYCLGDIVGYGPSPNECIQLVRERCTAVVMGNHDSGVLGKTPLTHFNEFGRSAIKWTKKEITPEHLLYLNSLPLLAVHGDVTLAHASPMDPSDWIYIMTWPAAQRCFESFKTKLCFIGHTHVPVTITEGASTNQFTRNSRHLINVGSVGQPRDGKPQASFYLVDTEEWTAENIRTGYEIQETAKAIEHAGLPDFLAERLFLGI